MRYYLDTEFNGYRGELISLALVREDGRSLYIVLPYAHMKLDPWVEENVISVLKASPEPPIGVVSAEAGARRLADFLAGDPDPVIVSDWPDDVRYFCELAITGPGTMIEVPGLKFEVHRVDAYPNEHPAAVQHNAWWDAVCLAEKLGAELGG